MYDFYKAFDRYYKADELAIKSFYLPNDKVTVTYETGERLEYESDQVFVFDFKTADGKNPLNISDSKLCDLYVAYHHGYYHDDVKHPVVLVDGFGDDNTVYGCTSLQALMRQYDVPQKQADMIPDHDSYSEFVVAYIAEPTSIERSRLIFFLFRISEVEVPMVDLDD